MKPGEFKFKLKMPTGEFLFGDRKHFWHILGALIFIFAGAWIGICLPQENRDWISLSKYGGISLLILLNSFYAGARYLRDIYELEFWDAFRYLFLVFFGFNMPKRKITGGCLVPVSEYDFLEKIGGPCRLDIGRDNLVIVETLQEHKNVLFAGQRRLTRFDSIKDILSTEEQYGETDEIKAMTADGIEVIVKGTQFRFRIDGSFKHEGEAAQTIDYVPSKRAVVNLVYQRPARKDGTVSPWTEAVSGKVSSIIRDYIGQSYLDDLIAPRETEEHPLDELRKKFMSQGVRDQFKNMGVRFIACSIGQIIVPDADVDAENLKMWFTKQTGTRKVIRAQGEAELFASQVRGRSEGQEMLLKSIAHALQELGIDGREPSVVRRNLRNILLTRTAQILEARTSIYRNHEEKDNGTTHPGNL